MLTLADGITSRTLDNGNGLSMCFLEAGRHDAPLVVLLHGFPELAYSWRQLIVPIANLGFHVVAPDQRGYGNTTGHSIGYEVDLTEFGMINLARDVVGLVSALGHKDSVLIAGHDFGSPVAAWSALLYPDIFQNVVLMSAPFEGPPDAGQSGDQEIHRDLAQLSPPRKHYQWYYGERGAEANMLNAPCGFPDFLRAYFHCKSADWPGNHPHRLASWSADQLAKMPRYYIMDLDAGMAETAQSMAPSKHDADACRWLDSAELLAYAAAFERTGLQGGLNWYRRSKSIEEHAELSAFSGQKIKAPLTFIGGELDWGVHQVPGALERMETGASTDYRGTHFIPNAGHWVQQEQPAAVLDVVGAMLQS